MILFYRLGPLIGRKLLKYTFGFFNGFFSLRLLIVNNINGLKKVRGHRGLEQILNELVEMYWDIFPRNEAICVGIMLTRSSLLYLKDMMDR